MLKNIKKIKYGGRSYFVCQMKFDSVPGLRCIVNGLTFLVINEGLSPIEKRKIFHALIKGKNLCDKNGKKASFAK
jgi:hypothetical protein